MGERREIREWLGRTKLTLNRHCTGIFGRKTVGAGVLGGTGFLLRIKGLLSVLTCQHVILPLTPPLHLLPINGTPQVHNGDRYYSSLIDLGYFFPTTGTQVEGKTALEMSNAVFDLIPAGEAVVVYGFPMGNPRVQQGMVVSGQEVHFTSMTLLSVTEDEKPNGDLQGRFQPTIRWAQGEMLDERLKLIDRKLVAQGFSGGPVFLAESLRLIGHVTHSDDSSLYYTPISRSLHAMRLNSAFVHVVG